MNFFNNLIYLILSRLNLLKRQIISGNYFLRKEKKNEFDFKVLNDLRNFGYCIIENYYEKEKCE